MTSAVLFGAAVVLAQPFVDSCWILEADTARAGLAFYLDPTTASSNAATMEAVRAVEAFAGQPGILDDPFKLMCLESAVRNASGATDPNVLVDAVSRFVPPATLRLHPALIPGSRKPGPTRDELGSALRECSRRGEGCAMPHTLTLIDHLRTVRDPREWEPAHVAAVIHSAREIQRSTPGESANLYSILVGLRAMGFRRTFELINISGRKMGSLVSPKETHHARFSHFNGEDLLYSDEWLAQRRIAAAPQGSDRQAYAGRRWMETDEAAPRPDLALVEKILERIEGVTESSPTPVPSQAPRP